MKLSQTKLTAQQTGLVFQNSGIAHKEKGSFRGTDSPRCHLMGNLNLHPFHLSSVPRKTVFRYWLIEQSCLTYKEHSSLWQRS